MIAIHLKFCYIKPIPNTNLGITEYHGMRKGNLKKSKTFLARTPTLQLYRPLTEGVANSIHTWHYFPATWRPSWRPFWLTRKYDSGRHLKEFITILCICCDSCDYSCLIN